MDLFPGEENLPEGVFAITDGDEVVGLSFEKDLVLSDEDEERVNEFLTANGMPSLPVPS